MLGLSVLVSFISLLPAFTFAIVQEWGQCVQTAGETICAPGLTCRVINPWYSQCLLSSSVPDPTNNPYVGHDVYKNPFYTDEIAHALPAIADPITRAKAATVADQPTFIWVDSLSVISSLSTMMNDANLLGTINGRPQLVQIVIYNLPGRDCSAPGSSGDFSLNSGGLALYKNFIDQIAMAISQYPNVRVVAIIEPKSLSNIVSNMHIPKCQVAANIYHAGVVYALQTLNPLSVYMYVDASHAGILGWPSNLSPAAQLFAQLYNDAGQPAFFRGLATNVANYNKLRALTPDSITSPNPNFDELHYIEALAPLLSAQGFSAHFIVDQSRAAVQGIRADWVEWCNIDHAGFGDRPTLNTGSPLIDAIVWAKLGGVSDGTSDPAAASYDPYCGRPTSKKPSPETNQWFQAYFEMLVQNAVPPL